MKKWANLWFWKWWQQDATCERFAIRFKFSNWIKKYLYKKFITYMHQIYSNESFFEVHKYGLVSIYASLYMHFYVWFLFWIFYKNSGPILFCPTKFNLESI
jgi:hypothetical protein